MLKKEFRAGKDLNRLRNLIKKDFGASVATQVGYTKSYVDRVEGEIWTEDNKTWTIKNGIKTTVSKLRSLKDKFLTPLVCPDCDKSLNTRNDKKMYSIHKKCMDCVSKMETKLRLEGKYEAYAAGIVRKNALSILDEAKDIALDALNNSTNVITEQGDIEEWVGGEALVEQKINEFIKQIDEIKKEIKID